MRQGGGSFPRWFVLLSILAIAVLAACGSGSDTTPTPAESSAQTASSGGQTSDGDTPSGIEVSDAWARPAMARHDDHAADDHDEHHEDDHDAHEDDAHHDDDEHAHHDHAGMGATGAAFMKIRNTGSETVRLIGAATTVAEVVEVHRTTIDANGVMRMEPLEALEIPAGETAELKPQGDHIMLIGLHQDLNVGESFNLTLQFEGGEELLVEVEVREP